MRSARSLTDQNRRMGERTRTVLADVVGLAPRSERRQAALLEAAERETTYRAAGLHPRRVRGSPGRLGAKAVLVLADLGVLGVDHLGGLLAHTALEDRRAPGPQRLADGVASVEDERAAHGSARTSTGPSAESRTCQPCAASSSRSRSASAKSRRARAASRREAELGSTRGPWPIPARPHRRRPRRQVAGRSARGTGFWCPGRAGRPAGPPSFTRWRCTPGRSWGRCTWRWR